MKIAFDAKRAFLNKRGLGTYSRNLIEGIQKYSNSECFLFTPKSKGTPFESISSLKSKSHVVEPSKCLHRLLPSYWRSYAVDKQLKTLDCDIYHGLSNEIPRNLDSLAVKKVVTIHDLLFLRYPENYSFIDRRTYKSKVKYACEQADCVIAISQQTKADLIHYLKVDESKIKIHYQSYHSRFEARCESLKIKKLKDKYKIIDKYLLCVGAIEPNKNILNLLDSFKKISTDHQLVVVGRGSAFKERVQQKIKDESLNAIILSDVSDSEMPVVFQGAELYVFPSLFEGFGLPIIEAMASGLPVLCNKTPAFVEVGADAVIFADCMNVESLATKINEVLADDQLRAAKSKAGLERAKIFSQKNCAETMLKIYESIM